MIPFALSPCHAGVAEAAEPGSMVAARAVGARVVEDGQVEALICAGVADERVLGGAVELTLGRVVGPGSPRCPSRC